VIVASSWHAPVFGFWAEENPQTLIARLSRR
jgi:hypothetical protein